ncbi:hypothetical protein BDB01DRAFT_835084 [Pilobolus umbonatus]|nr:hypothetical protein BDB01DRAFT_835084 [Pilobolus umbonatus]
MLSNETALHKIEPVINPYQAILSSFNCGWHSDSNETGHSARREYTVSGNIWCTHEISFWWTLQDVIEGVISKLRDNKGIYNDRAFVLNLRHYRRQSRSTSDPEKCVLNSIASFIVSILQKNHSCAQARPIYSGSKDYNATIPLLFYTRKNIS